MQTIDLLKVVTIARGEAKLIVDDLDLQDGKQGKRGIDGRDGVDGVDGKSGIDGKHGDRGVDGLHGDTGNQGDRGLRGHKGNQGLAGDVGAIGDAGIAGPQGPQGDTGPQGPKGDDGEQGVGVKSAKVHESDGHLYVTLTNDVTVDAGKVNGAGGVVGIIGGGSVGSQAIAELQVATRSNEVLLWLSM